MIKLLIYDLDGTLIDSKKDIACSVNRTLQNLGLHSLPEPVIAGYVGNGVPHLMTQVLTKVGITLNGPDDEQLKNAVVFYKNDYAQHLLDHTRLYPSVPEVLERFKHLKQGVITNKPGRFTRIILKILGVDRYFFRMVGSEDEFERKPSPASVLDMMQSTGARPEETLIIGDSLIDIQTARNANVKIAAVSYGFSKKKELEEAKPDFLYDDLIELTRCQLFS